MIEFDYIIKDEIGIHARPAGLLVKRVKELGHPVTVAKNDKVADATRLMAIMQLGVKHGDTVHVTVDTEDEASAQEIKAFFEENL